MFLLSFCVMYFQFLISDFLSCSVLKLFTRLSYKRETYHDFMVYNAKISTLPVFLVMLSSLQFVLYSPRLRHSFSFVSACRFRHGPVCSQWTIRGGSKRWIEIVTTAKVTSLTLVWFPRNSTSVHFELSNTESALWETNSCADDFEAVRKV